MVITQWALFPMLSPPEGDLTLQKIHPSLVCFMLLPHGVCILCNRMINSSSPHQGERVPWRGKAKGLGWCSPCWNRLSWGFTLLLCFEMLLFKWTWCWLVRAEENFAMLFEENWFSACPPEYLVPAGHYMIDCTLYLLFIPVLPVYKATVYLALVLKDSKHDGSMGTSAPCKL